MKTKITMVGKANDAEHRAVFESESSPEDIFSELPGGVKELFQRETGVQCSKVKFDIEFEMKTFFGYAGFQTNDLEKAISKSKELLGVSEDDLIDNLLEVLIKKLPSPEILHSQAVLAYASGNTVVASLICDLLVTMGEAAEFEIKGQQLKTMILEKIKQDAKKLLGEE